MTLHAEPLARQPALGEYVGSYSRPPGGDVEIREEDGRLVVQNAYALVFWGRDLAYSAPPRDYTGMPVEFIRDDSGAVTWVRVNGRIARKQGR